MRLKHLLGSVVPLIFFVVGIFFLVKVGISYIKEWIEQQRFVEVSATLTDVYFDWKAGESSNYIYTINAYYQYEYNNNSYVVKKYEEDIRDSSYHYMVKRDKEAMIAGWQENPVTTLTIDPQKPEQFQYGKRIDFIFVLLFTLLPGSFIFFGAFMLYRNFKSKPVRLDNNLKPWLHKWKSNVISCNTRANIKGTILIAIFWNFIAYTIILIYIQENSFDSPIILLIAIFPATGLFLIFKSFSNFFNFIKYGTAELKLDPFPAALGGDFAGQIVFNKTPPLKV